MTVAVDVVRKRALRCLRDLVEELGSGGGLLTPSVYDTARVAALLPDRPRTGEALDWLATRQQSDGGWGHPGTPLARDLPTLAAVLTLARHPAHRPSAARGVEFLRRHAVLHWGGPLPPDIPVGLELLLPPLLDEARAAQLPLPTAPYDALRRLGDHRRGLVARRDRQVPGTAAVHSWEGWADPAQPLPVDNSGGIGHSPAATATALNLTPRHKAPATLTAYLAHATAVHPPLMPTVWPIDNFERTWALHAVALASLLRHPRLADAVDHQLDLLHASHTATGIGMSDHFRADGDITATATAVLALAGRQADMTAVDRFRHEDHYRTYPDELQPSLTTTAHALHAHMLHTNTTGLRGARTAHGLRFLRDRQSPDGRWHGDKWHSSWIYTTAQVVISLPTTSATRRGIDALLNAQLPDGGWGTHHRATAGETGYATLALHKAAPRTPDIAAALEQAGAWLTAWQETSSSCSCDLWIGKELYCPTRIDRTVAHAALIAATHHTQTRA